MPPPPRPESPWSHVFAGTQLAITVIVFLAIGHAFDRKFGTEPWGTLSGAGVGIIGGLYNFLKDYLRDTDRKN